MAIAESASIDMAAKKVYIDGQEVPYVLAEEPTSERVDGFENPPLYRLHLTVLANGEITTP